MSMQNATETPGVREAVGVFESAEKFQEAIDELMSSGFDRAEISLLASESAVEQKLGHKYKRRSASLKMTRLFPGPPTYQPNLSAMRKEPSSEA
jgi:hypothetical protein